MTEKSIKFWINALSLTAIAAGLFGMLFCFIFLWSAKMEDLVGAGFPFVGGAILFAAGLITLGITNRQRTL